VLTRVKRPKSNVSAPGIWQFTVAKVKASFNAKKNIWAVQKKNGVGWYRCGLGDGACVCQ
jgi:hypothetical protein